MFNLVITSQGPTLAVGGVGNGETITVSLSGGAVLEVSSNLSDWSVLATQSGPFSAVTPEGRRSVMRFNLPIYNGTPIEVSVE